MSDSKIVCGCRKVTEQDIIDAVNNGAKSFEEVQEVTKVGTGCGKCKGHNREFVESLLAK